MRPVDDPIGHDLAGLAPAPLDDYGLLFGQVTELDGKAEVVLLGELDAASAPSLRHLADRLGVGQGRPLVLDVSGLAFLDLAGLRELAACCRNGRGSVTVRGISPFSARVVRLAGLEELFDAAEVGTELPPAPTG